MPRLRLRALRVSSRESPWTKQRPRRQRTWLLSPCVCHRTQVPYDLLPACARTQRCPLQSAKRTQRRRSPVPAPELGGFHDVAAKHARGEVEVIVVQLVVELQERPQVGVPWVLHRNGTLQLAGRPLSQLPCTRCYLVSVARQMRLPKQALWSGSTPEACALRAVSGS